MPTITVRNVPPIVHEKLKRRAKAHNRSLNGEVLELLEQATLQPAEEPTKGIVERLRRERERTPTWNVTDKELKREMREGLL